MVLPSNVSAVPRPFGSRLDVQLPVSAGPRPRRRPDASPGKSSGSASPAPSGAHTEGGFCLAVRFQPTHPARRHVISVEQAKLMKKSHNHEFHLMVFLLRILLTSKTIFQKHRRVVHIHEPESVHDQAENLVQSKTHRIVRCCGRCIANDILHGWIIELYR